MTDPIDPSAETLHQILQRAYADDRAVHRKAFIEMMKLAPEPVTPDPATIDVAEPENG